MTLQTNILPPENAGFGFFGTFVSSKPLACVDAWNAAFREIHLETGITVTAVRDFLDSKHGRSFAGDMLDEIEGGLSYAQAAEAVMRLWSAQKLNASQARHFGLKAGTTYRNAFIIG